MEGLTTTGEEILAHVMPEKRSNFYVSYTNDNIEDIYQVDRCAKWIFSNGFSNVSIILHVLLIFCF